MLTRSNQSVRLALVTFILFCAAVGTPGCSSKPAETDTAEVVPDPAVKPAPAPEPSGSPASRAVEVTPSAADETKP